MKCRGKILFLFLSLFLVLASCLNWFLEKPTFTPKEVAITRLSSTEMNILFGIEVQNPNSFDIKLKALEYTIYINDQEVGKGRLDKEALVAKSSATLVQVPLQASFKNLGVPLGFALSGKDLLYRIEGVAIIKASLGTATFPFSKTGEIKLKK